MTKTDKMSSYGLYLQTVRVEKGISIDDVAAETRIRAEILRSIEAEDHDNLPDDVFVKGFLRTFATVIGADPEEVLRRFEIRRKTQVPVQTLPTATPPRKGRFWLTLLWVAALMVGLVGGTMLIYQLMARHGTDAAPPPEGKREQKAVLPESPPEQEVVVPEAPGESVGPEKESTQEAPSYRLEIVCHEDTWLKAIADDTPAEEFFLKPGDTLRLNAKNNFNLLIGNAAGVSVQLNGNPVPVPGDSGQVVNLQLP
jgi:cytoskeleton protein RodZ